MDWDHLLNLPIDNTREVFGCGGRCGGAGNLRDDIFEYKHQVDSCTSIDDERRSFLLDMGVNALRLVLFPTHSQRLCSPSHGDAPLCLFRFWENSFYVGLSAGRNLFMFLACTCTIEGHLPCKLPTSV